MSMVPPARSTRVGAEVSIIIGASSENWVSSGFPLEEIAYHGHAASPYNLHANPFRLGKEF
jgi:hypothetical protein